MTHVLLGVGGLPTTALFDRSCPVSLGIVTKDSVAASGMIDQPFTMARKRPVLQHGCPNATKISCRILVVSFYISTPARR